MRVDSTKLKFVIITVRVYLGVEQKKKQKKLALAPVCLDFKYFTLCCDLPLNILTQILFIIW